MQKNNEKLERMIAINTEGCKEQGGAWDKLKEQVSSNYGKPKEADMEIKSRNMGTGREQWN